MGLYRYTQHLRSLDSLRPPPGIPVDHRLLPSSTPLNSEAWKACLSTHPDRAFAQYVVQGLVEGFRIGFNRTHLLKSAKRNMISASEHPDVILKYLKTEEEAGRVLGPFEPNELGPPAHISPIGIIPKRHQENAWRLIVDMSSPEGFSINDGIAPSMSSLEYIRIQDVIRQIILLGPNTQLAKIDIKSAYRVCPVHPDDRLLLGMSFQGKVYIDTALPFGMRSAPKIFNAVADALLWILKEHGVSALLHYLDDFITFGSPNTSQCSINCQIIFGICEILCIPLASDKCQGPCSLLDYLGFALDTTLMTVSLPRDKLTRLSDLLAQWHNRKACTKHDLDSLIGQLQHASAIIKPGRSFLRRMIILSKSRRCPSHPIRLNQGFRSDLAWWSLFLHRWNGITLMSALGIENPTFTVTSDASGSWGCGAYSGNQWFQLQWDSGTASKSIAYLELVPILIAGLIWGRQWSGSYVRCRCDNQSVVDILHSRYSRDDDLMHLLRSLFFIEAAMGFNLLPVHISGVHNDLADHLSRNCLSLFKQKAPAMDPRPTPIPREISTLLFTSKVDWLSKTWTSLFNSILSKV